jgi:HK97 family phage portal protein
MSAKRTELNWIQRTIGSVALRALKYSGIPLRDPALVQLFGTQATSSGANVDEDTALNFSAVWSAISLISGSAAYLPACVIRNNSGSTDPYDHDHNVAKLLNVSPNKNSIAFTLRETLQAYALAHGNGYARITRDGKGPDAPPVELELLPSNHVQAEKNEQGELEYHYAPEEDEPATFKSHEVFHIPGLSGDGIQGYSVIQRAREAIGLGLATEEYGASFFGKGAMPRVAVTHPEKLTKKAQKNFRESWNAIYNNAESPHGVALLPDGMGVTTIGLPNNDSQFLETRQFQVVEISRWYRVPPIFLYSMEGATLGNAEQLNLHFLQFTLLPWLTRWAQEVRRKLFTLADHRMYGFDFDTSYLLQADLVNRYSAYATGRNGGWLTLNDILRKERMPTLKPEVGDMHIAPSTMKTLERQDPTAAIPVETISALLEQLKLMRNSLGVALPEKMGTLIITSAIPSATNDLVAQLVAFCKSTGTMGSSN